jgi:excisionase family DNA binding protein
MTAAFLRRKEAAHYLGISERALSEWQRRGVIPFYKPARRVCSFAVADLEKAMQRFRVAAVGEGK